MPTVVPSRLILRLVGLAALGLALLLTMVLGLSVPLPFSLPAPLRSPVPPTSPAPPPITTGPLQARVVRVADGDSLQVTIQATPRTVRLACIDAPELDQPPWGNTSRAWLQSQLPPGTPVRLVPKATDRYGRLVAELIVPGAPRDGAINRWLVEEGQAFVYPRHVDQCDAALYRAAEHRARGRGDGVWQPAGGIERPWDHRLRPRAPRHAQPLERPSSSPPASPAASEDPSRSTSLP